MKTRKMYLRKLFRRAQRQLTAFDNGIVNEVQMQYARIGL